jgi:hypothetical protein
MNNRPIVVTMAALAFVFATRPASAQAPPEAAAAPAAQAQASLSADGELVSVDTKANLITIKTATAPEMKFKFDDTTKVTGGQKGVAGLATMAGSQVTIQYRKDGADNRATSIMVKPAAAAPRTESPRSPEPTPKAPEPAPRPEQPEK